MGSDFILYEILIFDNINIFEVLFEFCWKRLKEIVIVKFYD